MPFTFVLLFLCIVFLHGDFWYLIYITPFALISWLYRHVAYYFITFLDTNSLAIREFSKIIVLGKNISKDAMIASYSSRDICFSLSDKALNEYGSEYNHQVLLQGFKKISYY
jgi:hypothetical protein